MWTELERLADTAGAASIVKTALDEFGKIDGIVSNAGILRDGTFHKMTDEAWDSVLKVHLYGGYNVIRAAWPHFREQGFAAFLRKPYSTRELQATLDALLA